MPVDILSDSQTSQDGSPLIYRVMVSPWENPRENICECKGYFYNNGRCKHQEMAQTARCGWTELQVVPPDWKPKYVQTPEQRKGKICPRCEGPTVWKMEVDEDEEDLAPTLSS